MSARSACLVSMVLVCLACLATAAIAQDFATGARRNLLHAQSSALPQGDALIEAGERAFAPGQRSPWHTAPGPKFLYVVEGTITVAGQGGKVLLTCGPAPKLCLHGPLTHSWFFRNSGSETAKVMIIGLDPANNATSHELVGRIVGIGGTGVTLALGNANKSGVSEPHKETTVVIADVQGVAVGDHVMTQRFDEKHHSASSLVKLSSNWE